MSREGVANTRIAELVDATVTTVLSWRGCYQSRGLAGLADAPRPGRPRTLDHGAIVAATLKSSPKKLGVPHWSSPLLAGELKIGNASVARAWQAYGIKPSRAESFRFSTDPELVGKVTRHLSTPFRLDQDRRTSPAKANRPTTQIRATGETHP